MSQSNAIEPATSPDPFTVQSYATTAPFLERMEALLLADEARYGLVWIGSRVRIEG